MYHARDAILSGGLAFGAKEIPVLLNVVLVLVPISELGITSDKFAILVEARKSGTQPVV